MFNIHKRKASIRYGLPYCWVSGIKIISLGNGMKVALRERRSNYRKEHHLSTIHDSQLDLLYPHKGQ